MASNLKNADGKKTLSSMNNNRNMTEYFKDINYRTEDEQRIIIREKIKLENSLIAMRKQFANVENLFGDMQNLSVEILGKEDKTTSQFQHYQKITNSVSAVTTTSLFPAVMSDLKKIELNKKNLVQYVNDEAKQLDSSFASLAKLDDLVPLLHKKSQLNFNSASSKNKLDKDELSTKLNFFRDWSALNKNEIAKNFSPEHDVNRSFSAFADISNVLATSLPDFSYTVGDFGIQKEKLKADLEITITDLAVRKKKGLESTHKLNQLEINAIEQFNRKVYQLEQEKLKYQLSSGTKAFAQLADISTKYLSAEHDVTKSLSSISKSFELSSDVIPRLNDGLKGFDIQLEKMDKDYQQKKSEIEIKATQYPELAKLWQYSGTLVDKQYGRDVRDITAKKDSYRYDEMSSLFSGYSDITTDTFGQDYLASKVLGGVSQGFSIANQLTSGSNRLDQISDEQTDIQTKYEDDIAYQKAALDQKLINEQQYTENVVKLNQDMTDQLGTLQQDYTMTSIDMFSSMSDGIAEILKNTAGEGSKAYKIMFLASKASALAQAVVNTEVAATKALELGGTLGTVMSGVVRGMGYASIGIIASQALSGQAHAGIDYIPKEGTWLLDKGERVVDARTNTDLKNFLQSSSQDKLGLSVNVPVTISGSDVSEEEGKQLGAMIKQSVMSIIQEQQRPGGILNHR